jgi:hypothetical protein
MKTYYWLNQNRFLSHLRFATAMLIACSATVLISATTPAVAGEMVPFNGTVSGYINALPSDVVNFGHANQLGAFTGRADFYPNPPDPVSGCFTYTGFFHWMAANGDKLEGSFEGYSCPTDTPGVYDNHETADVDPIASTGRFAGATGHFELGGRIDFTTVPPSFVLPWEGTISRPGGRN